MVMIANASPRNLSAKFGVCCFPSTPPASKLRKCSQCQSSDKLRWPRFISESNSMPFIIPRLQTTQTRSRREVVTRPMPPRQCLRDWGENRGHGFKRTRHVTTSKCSGQKELRRFPDRCVSRGVISNLILDREQGQQGCHPRPMCINQPHTPKISTQCRATPLSGSNKSQAILDLERKQL